MTTTAPSSPPPAIVSPPGTTPGGGAPGPAGRRASSLLRTDTTPGWYRLTGLVTIVAIVVVAAAATAAALVVQGATQTIESNVAPSLIEAQELSASVAEANAAATAEFLSASRGAPSRPLRILYLEARNRGAGQTGTLAGLAGDDPEAHTTLQEIVVALADYSGQIEASRAGVEQGSADPELLRQALDTTDERILVPLTALTVHNRNRFDDNTRGGLALGVAAGVVGLVALGALARLQVGMMRRSNRVLNLALVAATGLVVVTLGLVVATLITRQQASSNADAGGYQAIVATSVLQQSAYELQSGVSLSLLGGATDTDLRTLLDPIEVQIDQVAGGADSPREQAAAAELGVRWARYRELTESILSQSRNQAQNGAGADQAFALFQGPGLSAFNGLNTSIESVLSDNRAQFTDGVGAATPSPLLPLLTVILPALAVVAVFVGVQGRLREYQ